MSNIFLIPSQSERAYAKPERLADVMALIQVLALAKTTHPTEDELWDGVQRDPRSGADWKSVAGAHPEFFRVNPDPEKKKAVSLIARHAQQKRSDDDGREPLDPAFVDSLLRAAVEMHDRQVRRRDRWTYLLPLWVALSLGILSLIGVILRIFFGTP
jgi:hypothetical protein